MVIVEAVVETYGKEEFTAWPVAGPVADGLLPLSGRMTAAEVGTVMAVIAVGSAYFAEEEIADTDGAGLLRHLARADDVIAPGGLRFRDNDIVVPPGCCYGLESWRDWLDLPSEPWLGHNPTPGLRHQDGLLRLWPDKDRAPDPPPEATIQFPTGQLPGLLAAVQHDLGGFLSLVARWAQIHTPASADRLVTVLDEQLQITAPLTVSR
ncbi:hypothetical protein SAMN04489712_1164 [Thermomonospora echinospora]|uniref:Uncharacterized protein n=1 Tax=Thermomonospora echinospora TaxID=1992 RepID=A0A1H6DDY6_9ACTN|nr:hypothetical protein [Thermomonospora echinospora]SEG83489.1 hypothetical protein SAMN04489712_1164 [Thermomonospora echinospora]